MDEFGKLDVAARLFPAVSGRNNSSVFRVAVVLTEPIDAHLLQLAVNTIYERYSMFFGRMRRGLFWNYFDQNHMHFTVEPESSPPCSSIVPHINKGFFIKVLYFGNRISVEVYHSVTDGSGLSEFLKSLLYYYLTFKYGALDHEGKILLFDEVDDSVDEDSFNKNLSREKKTQPNFRGHQDDAFLLKGRRYLRRGQSVTTGIVSVDKLKFRAKEHGCSISAYLIAHLIMAIYEQKQKGTRNKRPVAVAVPVNLRKIFDSTTLKNFFGVVNVGYRMTEETKFYELLSSITTQLGLCANARHMETIFGRNVKISRNIFSVHTPLVLKKLLIPVGFNLIGEVKKTLTFSNLGRIDLPIDVKKYVVHAEVLLYPTKKSPMSCGLCSIDDRLSISFTKTISDTSVIRAFFMRLGQDIEDEITVYSNGWGEEFENKFPTRL